MGFGDKLKALGEKVKVSVSAGTGTKPPAGGGVPSGQTPKGPGCVHCHQEGLCFACHGSGKTGNLSCVHCDGSGICKFCGADLIRRGLKAWIPYATTAAPTGPRRGKGCVHCNQTGLCFACHGSGKTGNLKCVHCGGTGTCKFCG